MSIHLALFGRSLSAKLARVGVALFALALLSISLTLWLTWQIDGGAAAVNEAGRMRMQVWRLTHALEARRPPQQVQELVAQFDQSLNLLRHGDASRPLFVPAAQDIHEWFDRVELHWTKQRQFLRDNAAPGSDQLQQSANEFVDAIDQYVQAIERRLSGFTALLNLFQFAMMVLAVAAAVIMLYIAYLFIIAPLAQLAQGLKKLEGANFGTRIEVATHDEFGQVAQGFNRMASTLQSLYAGLEAKVQAKTQHIEAQRARLQALYEVSAFLAKATTVADLAQGFCQRVRVIMGADAVAVRWSDEASQRYLMLASDCLPQEMQMHERSLAVGSCACTNLSQDARTRVISVHGHESAPLLGHCAKAGYHSIVSVPVRMQQRMIGEIDLFFHGAAALSADEAGLLDALAAHLASALEGLRAAALERESAVGEERSLLARELHDSIAQSLSFLKIQAQLLRVAVQRDQPDKVAAALDELDTGLKESINDVRELLMHFRTRASAQDIESAIHETAQKFQHQTGLPVHIKVHGHGLPLHADVQIQVLHVLQEALSNVRKHAHAKQVTLEVYKANQWHFVVSDDGQGFDMTRPLDKTHVGTKIMHERAAQIGARVQVESSPGGGTAVTLLLPVNPVASGGAERNLRDAMNV